MHIRSLSKRLLSTVARWKSLNAVLRRRFRRHLVVLCYHGIVAGNNSVDPGRRVGAVTTDEFREHLATIVRYYTPVSAVDVMEAVHGSGTLPDYAILLTFDDGLRNNFVNAAPILEQFGLPALFCVTTSMVDTGCLLWTHELYERILSWNHAVLPMPDNLTETRVPGTFECRTMLASRIRELCKRIPDAARCAYLERLRGGAELSMPDACRELYEVMTWDEVRELVSRGFEVGSHTVSHPILTRLSRQQVARELAESKARIEDVVGRACFSIAYPNGGRADVSASVVGDASKAGYVLGFTLSGRLTRSGASVSALEIGRVCIVPGLTRNAFRARLSGLSGLLRRF